MHGQPWCNQICKGVLWATPSDKLRIKANPSKSESKSRPLGNLLLSCPITRSYSAYSFVQALSCYCLTQKSLSWEGLHAPSWHTCSFKRRHWSLIPPLVQALKILKFCQQIERFCHKKLSTKMSSRPCSQQNLTPLGIIRVLNASPPIISSEIIRITWPL